MTSLLLLNERPERPVTAIMKWVWRPVAAVASGVLIALAMPPVNAWPLGWVAVVPLLAACRGQRFLVSFLLGIVASSTIAAVALSGAIFAGPPGEGEPTWVELGCTIFGAVVGLTAAIFAELRPGDLRRFVALAAFAVLFEAATLRVLPVSIALSEASSTPMRMVAAGVGMCGVAFLLWLSNILIADAILRREPVRWIPIGTGVCLLAVAGFGWERAASPLGHGRVVLVQSESTEHNGLASQSGHDPSALAVWPEFGGILLAPGGNAGPLRSITRRPDSPAIVTSFRDNHSPMPHNVAALFSRGTESSRYAKRMLFGGEVNMHTPGDRPVAASWNGNEVGLNICFDSCVPGLIRETARLQGVDLIALPTIDPPAPYHWLAAMHAAFTPFRAAEEGIPIARTDAYAYSEAVDGSGNVLIALAPGSRTAEVDVPLDRRWTLYRQTGDLFLPLCGLAVLAGLIPGSLWTRLRLPPSARKRPGPPSRG